MKQEEPPIFSDPERAASYDKRWIKLAPTRDALHLLIRALLLDLPENSRLLCVGAGTGSELLYLAQAFPTWQFTVVEPASPMLAICRQRMEDNGFAEHCTFHGGYLDSLPDSEPFDAATSLLVSHFLLQKEERIRYFAQIASRLRPGGYLVNADLSGDQSQPEYESLLDVWFRMMKYAEVGDVDREKMAANYKNDVAFLPLPEVASLMQAGGFEKPILFFQTLLIHAWYARRAA